MGSYLTPCIKSTYNHILFKIYIVFAEQILLLPSSKMTKATTLKYDLKILLHLI